MDLRSMCVRFGTPAALATLVACQPAVSPAVSVPTQPVAAAAPAPTVSAIAMPTVLPSGAAVTLEPIKDQVVLVDQVGYLPARPKIGLVADAVATSFQIVDVSRSRSVFEGRLGEPMRDPDTGQVLRRADFSKLEQPGSYTLQVQGTGRSPEFRIAEDVYRELYASALTSYEQLAALAPAPLQTATAKERKTGQVIDISGGWPDAGDYGRYMPSAASTMATLLLLDDLFPQHATAEQLRVFRCELDWMLRMQRSDGAVYHKVTPLNFGGFDKGSDNIGGELFVFDASTPDTAVFSAVLAEAARVYRPLDPTYADLLLSAAQKSWAWLVANPKPLLPAETEGTGSYVYGRDGSQRYWAAAELFKTTGDPVYAAYVRTYLDQHSPAISTLGWGNPETYGALSLAFNDFAEPALRKQIVQQLSRWADSMVTTVGSPVDPWGMSISAFHWASNKTTLDNSVLLLVANWAAPNPHYVDAALDQLHYVLGRNGLAKSYITGYGTNSVKSPHNRTMFTLGRLVPGVLVGGPNGDGQDGLTPPGKGQRSYVDELKAYASNENSVEYNAPLVFVTALFSSMSGG